MSSYVVVAAALLVFVVVVVAAIKNLGKGKLPPSPPSLPFVGHLHLVGELPHRSLDALHRRYGSDGGLMFLRLGRAGALVVSTAAAAADLYRGHDLAFASRPPSHSAERLFYGGRNMSFAPLGDAWRRTKKLAVAHLLSPRRAAEAARAVQLRELLYAYTNGVITRVAAGGSGATAERFRKMMADTSELLAGFQWVDRLPEAAGWAARKLTGLNKKLDDMADESDRFLGEILAAHDDEKAEGEEEDFVDVLLRLRRQGAAAAGGLELAEDNVKAIIKVTKKIHHFLKIYPLSSIECPSFVLQKPRVLNAICRDERKTEQNLLKFKIFKSQYSELFLSATVPGDKPTWQVKDYGGKYTVQN